MKRDDIFNWGYILLAIALIMFFVGVLIIFLLGIVPQIMQRGIAF